MNTLNSTKTLYPQTLTLTIRIDQIVKIIEGKVVRTPVEMDGEENSVEQTKNACELFRHLWRVGSETNDLLQKLRRKEGENVLKFQDKVDTTNGKRFEKSTQVE